MRVSIRDLRHVEKAEIDIEGVTVVAGRNHSGKSSICMAVASLLTGEPVPWPGVSKKDAGQLVRDGVSTASVAIAGDDFKMSVQLPKGNVITEGTPPRLSPYAAGLATLAGKPPKEVAPILLKMIPAQPTIEDLKADLEPRGMSAANIELTWKEIGTRGWEAVWAAMKDRAPTLKGQWEEVTGEAWGSAKAASWKPAGWISDLQDKSMEDLQAALGNAKAALDQAIGDKAVQADRRRRLEEDASHEATRREAVATARNIETQCKIALEAAQKALDRLPVEQSAIMPFKCPHCDEPFGIEVVETKNDTNIPFKREYVLHKHVGTATPGQNADVRKARTAARTELERCQANLRNATKQVETEEARLKTSTDAIAALARMGDPITAADPIVELAHGKVAAAQERLDLRVVHDRAVKIHRRIANVLAVIEATKADGVRLTVLSREIEKFNADQLAVLCAATGTAKRAPWPAVRFEADFTLTYGGRLYHLLSASEQWEVRAILAIAQALSDGSALAVLDGADILQNEDMQGLFSLVSRVSLPVLIGMTGTADTVPDMSRGKKPGVTYIVDNGVAVPLDKMRGAA